MAMVSMIKIVFVLVPSLRFRLHLPGLWQLSPNLHQDMGTWNIQGVYWPNLRGGGMPDQSWLGDATSGEVFFGIVEAISFSVFSPGLLFLGEF